MFRFEAEMIDRFDVDGFPVDTVKHVGDGFWEQWVPAIHDHADAAGKPDFVMFGEVFGETVEFRSRYSTELDFPATLDFSFNGARSGSATTDVYHAGASGSHWQRGPVAIEPLSEVVTHPLQY